MSIPSGIDLCHFPALAPPNGVLPNFVDPSPNLAPTLIGITSVMTGLGAFFVAGRLIQNRRKMHLSDYAAGIALVFDAALSGIILALHKYMRHQWDVPACWFTGHYMKLNFAVQLVMPLSHSFSKATILLLFLQIFTIDRRMRVGIYFGLVLTVLAYWPNLILVPVYSVPYAGQTWEDLLTEPRVHKMTPVGTEQGTLAVILDLYIFMLPMPALWKLKMNSSDRCRLIAVFGTAFAGVVASVVGLVFRVFLLHASDSTWSTARLYPCIIVEVWVALIVACMPAFAHFWRVHMLESISLNSFRERLLSMRSKNEKRSQTSGSDISPSPTCSGSQYHENASRWWPAFTRAQRPSTTNSRRKGEHVDTQTSDLGFGFDELNQSSTINQFQPEVVAASSIGQTPPPREPGIAVTKTYGFDTASQFDSHRQTWGPFTTPHGEPQQDSREL